MTIEADRYVSLAVLREARVTVSFEKRMSITPELEVVGSCVYSLLVYLSTGLRQKRQACDEEQLISKMATTMTDKTRTHRIVQRLRPNDQRHRLNAVETQTSSPPPPCHDGETKTSSPPSTLSVPLII